MVLKYRHKMEIIAVPIKWCYYLPKDLSYALMHYYILKIMPDIISDNKTNALGEKYLFGLPGFCNFKLQQQGAVNIRRLALDTYTQANGFFSFRGEGKASGLLTIRKTLVGFEGKVILWPVANKTKPLFLWSVIFVGQTPLNKPFS